MKNKIIILIFFASIFSYSQTKNKGTIQGKVYDAISGESIIGARLTIINLNIMIQSNEFGVYIFKEIPRGKYKIKCINEDYEENTATVEVLDQENAISNFRLKPKSSDSKKTFYIGGIEVTANSVTNNPSISTSTVLTGGEIEHLQASNLGDILQLLPGGQTINPSLSDAKQATIRQINNNVTARSVTSLGTQIIVDDIPISNNANLQGELGQILSTNGSGIDLRAIPADNVELVEVVRGIPSARYGDLAGGAIKVTTSKKKQPNRFKFKYNPDTQEMNFGGGLSLLDAIWSYNFNIARSVRDIRLDGDSYTRISGQISLAHNISKKWDLQHKISMYRIFDEFNETDDPYLNRQAHYNREFMLQYSINSNINFDENSKFVFISSFQYTNQDSYYQEEIVRDNSIFSTRLTNGTQQGVFVGGQYFSQYWTKGKPILAYSNIEFQTKSEFLGLENIIYSGINLKYEKNYGEGRIFNPLYPPRFNQSMGDRPRKYDNIPSEFLSSIFLVDKIRGNILLPFQVDLGLRYEQYDPNGILKASHGKYLNPRINFQLFLSEKNSIRFGYGISSKAPTLSQLYPNPRYFDVIDTSFYNNDPTKRFSLVSTYIVDVSNSQIKGFTQKSFDVGSDLNLSDWQLSLSAYNNETRDGINSLSVPIYLIRYSFPDLNNLNNKIPKDTGVSSLRSNVNNRYIYNSGIEFTLISPTIYFLNGRFQIDAAYSKTETGQTEGIQYDIDFVGLRSRQYFYRPSINWGDQFLISYKLTAASQVLGIWVTITLQQMLFERDKYIGLDDAKYPLGYTDKNGQTTWLSETERRDPIHKDYVKNYEPYQYFSEDRPNKFLLNIRVSKSLFSGSEISFFVNNFLNDRPIYAIQRTSQPGTSFERRNTPLYYGIEFSSFIDYLFKK